jgi:hypothetical protein
VSVTDGTLPVQFDLGESARGRSHRTASRMTTVRAQLEHLFPAAPFPLHLGYGPPPDGFRIVESWRVIPNPAAPRALVPVRPASARASLLSHNGLREPVAAFARLVAAASLRPLALAQGARGVLSLSVPTDVDDATADAVVITRHLRGRVPGAVDTAVSLRDFHPRAKPTVQLLDADGTVVAFAKVASDPATGERVTVEARLLAELGPLLDRPDSPIRLPRLLDQGRCGPFSYSVVQPLPVHARRAARSDEDRVLPALAEYAGALGPAEQAPLSRTSLWREVMDRVEDAQPAGAVRPDLVIALNQLVATVRGIDGGLVLPTGAYHGDWVPWNMGWADDTLWVWDLEYGSRSGPVGLDALRWVFQAHHVEGGESFSAAVAAMSAAAPRVLGPLGVDDALAPALVRLHVVETMATALGLLATGRGLPTGLDPDAVDLMQSLRLAEAA